MSKAEAYTNHGCSCYLKGFLDEAETYLVKGSAFCERINYFGMRGLANFFLGELYFERGKYSGAQGYYDSVISIAEHARIFPSFANASRIALARAKVMNNEKDIDLEALYEYEGNNKMKTLDGMMARYISEILLNIDDHHMSQAENWIKKALEMDKRNGTMFQLGTDYSLCAELLRRKGERPKAKENLIKAIEIFKECGADGWVKKAEQELASIS